MVASVVRITVVPMQTAMRGKLEFVLEAAVSEVDGMDEGGDPADVFEEVELVVSGEKVTEAVAMDGCGGGGDLGSDLQLGGMVK
ncbi:hypothetical protein HDU97_007865 [Phlyctochytrium planicorne]|nr:hypothetical protein HDU97_007865 [Phlyctochytrium planicorne]